MPSWMWPRTTGLGTILSSASSANTILRVWSEMTARSGIRRASTSPAKSWMRPKTPGVNSRSLLSTSARPADRAGAGIELVVDEIHLADVRPLLLVGKPDAHGIVDVARGPPRAGKVGARVAQIVVLGYLEEELNRVERDDRRQQRRASRSPLTRLPSLTFLSEMRPAIGALTSVHSKLNCAAFSAARAICSCACATARLAARCS